MLRAISSASATKRLHRGTARNWLSNPNRTVCIVCRQQVEVAARAVAHLPRGIFAYHQPARGEESQRRLQDRHGTTGLQDRTGFVGVPRASPWSARARPALALIRERSQAAVGNRHTPPPRAVARRGSLHASCRKRPARSPLRSGIVTFVSGGLRVLFFLTLGIALCVKDLSPERGPRY